VLKTLIGQHLNRKLRIIFLVILWGYLLVWRHRRCELGCGERRWHLKLRCGLSLFKSKTEQPGNCGVRLCIATSHGRDGAHQITNEDFAVLLFHFSICLSKTAAWMINHSGVSPGSILRWRQARTASRYSGVLGF